MADTKLLGPGKLPPPPGIEFEIVKPNEGGAPTVYTPHVVGRLVAAFNNGFNIKEACQYAGIHRDTYYAWLETKPGFSDMMEESRTAVNRKAKQVIVDAIQAGDVSSGKWWLERRDPEFKAKGEMDVGPKIHTETRDKIREFLDDDTDFDQAGADVASAESGAGNAATGTGEVAQTTPDIS